MKTITRSIFIVATIFCIPAAHADIFGTGAHTFDIDFVKIDNPGNAPDTVGSPNPAGAVDSTYRIGQFEVSEDMINKANALGGLGITHDNRGANKPATSVSWIEAAQFVNWLNTDSGFTPAYKFNGSTFELWTPNDAGYNPDNLYRNRQARYFLPSADEWYKAAYYDPANEVYFQFPTGSNTIPTPVASGTAPNTAVFSFMAGPADVTQAGAASPFGTVGQGGNVHEWEETSFDLLNTSSSSRRGVRGGDFNDGDFANMLSTDRGRLFPIDSQISIGFRVASIPEPSSLLLGGLASAVVLVLRKRPS